MKKRKSFAHQPLFKKDKDIAKLLKQDNCFEKLSEFANITAKIQNNINLPAKDLYDWQMKICAILPENFKNNQNLIDEISEMVVRYENSNKQ